VSRYRSRASGLRRWAAYSVVMASLAMSAAGCGTAGPGETIGSTSSAITFPNDQVAFDYFLGKGLTNFQAAGIVGNLDQESGVDPTAVEAGGPGRGIAQWSVGGRWDTDANDNATWYAQMEGQSVDSLQLQLDFIWYELTTFSNYGLAALKQTTNVTDATVVFETDFEGCGTCDQSTRISYAENVLSVFGSDMVDAGPVDAGSSPGDDSGVGTPCTVTPTGESGDCMDTSACAALGGHVSTPGYCPGPANVQCCTATAQPSEDAGGPSGHDAAAPTDATAPTKPIEPVDSGGTLHTPDAGGKGVVLDGATPGNADATPKAEADGGVLMVPASGGCATTPTSAPRGSNALWLVAVAWTLRRRRSRR
jgi:hypothetical protein